jgi:hypothetical protein
MPFVPKAPDSCADLDLGHVARVLARHRGYIPAAAKELGVSRVDLNHLTWSKPHLLDDAHEEMRLVALQAQSVVIRSIFSDDIRRQMWGCDKMMASYLARDHPLAPARRGRRVEAPQRQVAFRWDSATATDALERDGKTIAVPRHGGNPATPLAPRAGSTPSPPPLPKWPGPHAPPPLVAGKYQPWEPPQPKAPLRREAEREPQSLRSELRRRLSGGGYR